MAFGKTHWLGVVQPEKKYGSPFVIVPAGKPILVFRRFAKAGPPTPFAKEPEESVKSPPKFATDGIDAFTKGARVWRVP